MECPKCGRSDVQGSSRAGFWDHLAAFLLLTPVRCRKCRLRYYRSWFMVRRADAKPASVIEIRDEIRDEIREATRAPQTQPSVLLLDEDAALRKLLSRVLTREGYEVHEAVDPTEAMLELRAGAIDVVIINLSEEEHPGVVRDLRIAHPRLMIVALSSAGDAAELPASSPGGRLLILSRPVRPHALIHELKAMRDEVLSSDVHSGVNRFRPPSEAATPARPSASRVSRSSSSAGSSGVFAMKRAPLASRRPTMIPVSRPFFE